MIPIMERVFDTVGKIQQDLGDYEMVLAVSELVESIGHIAKTVTSIDQLNITSTLISAAAEMAELLQRSSIHNWDVENSVYELQRAGFTAQLVNGWLPFDTELRQASLRPGVSIPGIEPIDAINFGALVDDEPRAMAIIIVDFISPPLTVTADDSEIVPHWRRLDFYMQTIAREADMLLESVSKWRSIVQGDLVIESTGIGRLKNGKETGVYVGFRFHNDVAAGIGCNLVKPPWDEYRLCTSLTDNIRFAN